MSTSESGSLAGERIKIGDTTGKITETRNGVTTRHLVTVELGGVMQGIQVTDAYARENLVENGGDV